MNINITPKKPSTGRLSHIEINNNNQMLNRVVSSPIRASESQALLQELRSLEPGKYQSIQTKLILFFAEMERITLVNAELARENQNLKDGLSNSNHTRQIVKDQMKGNPKIDDQNMIIIADLKAKINLLLEQNSKLVEVAQFNLNEINELRKVCDILKKENQNLHLSLDQKHRDSQILHENFQSLESRYNILQRNHIELQKTYDDLNRNHIYIQKNLINQQQGISAENQALQNKISILMNEKEYLNNLLNEKTRQKESEKEAIPLKTLNEEKEELKRKCDFLQESLSKKSKDCENLTKSLEEIDNCTKLEIEKNKMTIEEKTNDVETWKNKFIELEKTFKDEKQNANSKISDLMSQLHDYEALAKKKYAEFEEKKVKFESENEKLKQDLDIKSKENESLELKYHDLEIQIQKIYDAIEQKNQEIDIFNNLKQENEALRLKLCSFDEISDLNKQLENCVFEMNIEKENIMKLLNEKSQELEQVLLKKRELEEDLLNINKLNNDLKQKLATSLIKVEESEKTRVMMRNSLKTQNKNSYEGHNSTFETEPDSEILKDVKISESMKENHNISKNMNDLSYENEVKQIHSENDTLRHYIQQLKVEIQKLRLENENLKTSYKHLKAENNEMSGKFARLNTIYARIMDLENHLSTLKNDNEKLSSAFTEKANENDNLILLIKDLKDKLQKLSIEYNDLNILYNEALREVEKYKHYEELNITDYTKRCGDSSGFSAFEKLCQQEQTCEVLVKKINEIDKEKQEMSIENDNLKKYLNELLIEYDILKKSMTKDQEWEKKYMILQAENNKLLLNFNDICQDIHLLKQKILEKDNPNNNENNNKLDNQLQTYIELLEKHNMALKESLNDKIREINDLKREYMQFEKDKDKLVPCGDNLENKNKNLYGDKGEARHDFMDKYDNHEEDVENEYDNMKDKMNDYHHTQIKNLENKLRLFISENERLNIILNESIKEIDDLRNKLKVSTPNEGNENGKLQRLLLDKEEDINKKNKRIDLLEQENKQLKKKTNV